MTFETIAALIIIVLTIMAGVGPILGPLWTRVIEMARRVEDLEKERRLLTDYKEITIEQVTRLVEQVRSIIAEMAASKELRDSQFTDVNLKIDREIHGQGDTRMEWVTSLQLAVKDLDAKFLAALKSSQENVAQIAALEVQVEMLMKDRKSS